MQYVECRPHVARLRYSSQSSFASRVQLISIFAPFFFQTKDYATIFWDSYFIGLPIQRTPNFSARFQPTGTIASRLVLSLLHTCVLRFKLRFSIPSPTRIIPSTFLLLSLRANPVTDLMNPAQSFKRHFRRVSKNAKSDCYLRDVCLCVFPSVLPYVCLSVSPSVSPSVRPSAWDNSSPTRRISMKIEIWLFFENLSWKFESG
jgi:hypothetical protein